MAAGRACRIPLFNGTSFDFLKPFSSIHLCKRTSASLYHKNRKGTEEDVPEESFSYKLNYVMRNFVPETKKFAQEWKRAIVANPMLEANHGNYESVFRFDSKPAIDSWIVTADKDNQGGKSSASFVLSQNRTGLFRGNLCSDVPKDGKTKYSGYCNITYKVPMRSFARENNWDWSIFNSLLMKVRGDGRAYMVVIGTRCYSDINWLNRWSFPLYTRGGPYWQTVKIPFSKFIISYKGRVQDKQEHLPLSMVNSFGITIGNSAEGPFCLEIDSVAVMYDINLSSKHAYELYQDRNLEGQT
uniref:NADH:ubiquinone oxidoreductase intermediate-associated protein 30 domain-containing protein n=1 Tax=Arion vulgaris TaxID=1028688 RepID=A0A0B7BEJ1_9EUPU